MAKNNSASAPPSAPGTMTSSEVTPSDSPVATPRRVPQRGTRKRVIGGGEGDYLIYEIIGEGGAMPRGSLIPIPGVPQFEDTQRALTWIRQQGGDLLAGKQVMIFRACEILSLTVQAKPQVVIQAKSKVTVTKPAPETSS